MTELSSHLLVSVVAVDHAVWSGAAKMVTATTTEGELGVLPGHAPLLGQLVDGSQVKIETDDGDHLFEVYGGYLSVTDEGVSIPVESAKELDASAPPS
ncbi:MAG: F0F1 ATP synthase subunit epsilon [Acidimicrobiales bacterium]|nr:MAG: F0F1 ATP synthase subunit epsilon [Acidimicrobiales bacterium]